MRCQRSVVVRRVKAMYVMLFQELEEKLESREIEYRKCERLYAQREEQHLRTIKVLAAVTCHVTTLSNQLCFKYFLSFYCDAIPL